MHAVANAVHCQGRLLRCRIDPRGRPKSHQGGLSRGPVGPQGSPSWPASSHRSSVAAIPARRCVPTSACTCRMRCWGAPSSAWMPPPGGRGVRGGCPVHLRWLERASQRAYVGQTIVDSAGLPPVPWYAEGPMPFCLLHPQPRALCYPVPPHILRNLAQGIRNPSGPSRTVSDFSPGRGSGGVWGQHAHGPYAPRSGPIPEPLEYVQGGT